MTSLHHPPKSPASYTPALIQTHLLCTYATGFLEAKLIVLMEFHLFRYAPVLLPDYTSSTFTDSLAICHRKSISSILCVCGSRNFNKIPMQIIPSPGLPSRRNALQRHTFKRPAIKCLPPSSSVLPRQRQLLAKQEVVNASPCLPLSGDPDISPLACTFHEH